MPIVRPRYRRKLRKPMTRLAIARGVRLIRRRIYGGQVHRFIEKTQLPSIGVSAGSSAPGVITYKLNDLTNAASFKSLFDLYKLTGVKLTFIPLFNTSQTSDLNTLSQAGTLPMLYVAPNRDPYVPAPTSVADILNDDGCKIIRLTKPVSMYIKSPKPNLLTDSGAAIPLQTNVSTQFWLTTGGNGQVVDQSSVPHHGHRFFLTNNATSEVVIQVYAKYYFAMKEQD